MTIVSVVYHSGYGHTARQAEAVARGALTVPAVTVNLIKVEDAGAHWDNLAASEAIIFGAPTYMGSASAAFKSFMDASSKVFAIQGWKDKLAAGFTNSASQSGDKLATLEQMAIFAAQHGMVWVSLGLLPGNNSSTGSLNDLNRLGSNLGAMAQSNADQSADQGPISSDLRTAEFLGKRVAQAAQRWNAVSVSAAA